MRDLVINRLVILRAHSTDSAVRQWLRDKLSAMSDETLLELYNETVSDQVMERFRWCT